MSKHLSAFGVTLASTLLLAACTTPPPVARTETVVETIYGVTLRDPYRWMEKEHNSGELERWLINQSEYTESLLSEIPERDVLYRRLLELSSDRATASSLIIRRDELFFLWKGTGDSVPKLVNRDAGGNRSILLDPANEKQFGDGAAITDFSVSPDARIVAVNVTTNGSEYTSIHFVDVASGRMLEDRIDSVWGEFEASWTPDSKAVYYIRINAEAVENPQVDDLINMQAFRRELGSDPATDTPVFVRSSPASSLLAPETFPMVEQFPNGEWEMLQGVGAHPAMQLLLRRTGHDEWKEIARLDDHIDGVAFWQNTLYMLDHSEPGRSTVRALDLDHDEPDLKSSRVVYSTDRLTIDVLVAGGDALYMHAHEEGISRILRIEHDRTQVEALPVPLEGAIREFRADPDQNGVSFVLEDWNTPPAYYRYQPDPGFVALALMEHDAVPQTRYAVTRINATSADGTLIPVTVIHREGLRLDGKRPTILFGYGGYGLTIRPFYDPTQRAWTERDAVFAYAHVRGGGIHGPAWHRAGSGRNKPTGIADFIAAAEALIAHRYTDVDHIAAYGASMGGVLIGRAITQRPDLFRAAAIHVGALNVVRFLKQDNGANQKVELGYSDDEEGFRTLLAQDSYHNVKRGVAYPSTFLTVGLHDKRVPPWETAKFAARLAAFSATDLPVLIRADGADGHGLQATREQRAARVADLYSFLLNRFGEPGFEF